MDIWEDFERKTEMLAGLCENKEVIIWGYGLNGWFVEHLLSTKDIKVKIHVDKNQDIKAYRPYYIRFFKITSGNSRLFNCRDESA